MVPSLTAKEGKKSPAAGIKESAVPIEKEKVAIDAKCEEAHC